MNLDILKIGLGLATVCGAAFAINKFSNQNNGGFSGFGNSGVKGLTGVSFAEGCKRALAEQRNREQQPEGSTSIFPPTPVPDSLRPIEEPVSAGVDPVLEAIKRGEIHWDGGAGAAEKPGIGNPATGVIPPVNNGGNNNNFSATRPFLGQQPQQQTTTFTLHPETTPEMKSWQNAGRNNCCNPGEADNNSTGRKFVTYMQRTKNLCGIINASMDGLIALAQAFCGVLESNPNVVEGQNEYRMNGGLGYNPRSPFYSQQMFQTPQQEQFGVGYISEGARQYMAQGITYGVPGWDPVTGCKKELIMTSGGTFARCGNCFF